MTEIQPVRMMRPNVNYNAVKIDIHNPQAKDTAQAVKIDVNNPQVKVGNKHCSNPVHADKTYDMPQKSVYDMPEKSIYEPKKEEEKKDKSATTPIVPAPVVIAKAAVEPVKVEEPASVLKAEKVETPVKAEPETKSEVKDAPKEPKFEAKAENKTIDAKISAEEEKKAEAAPKTVKIEEPKAATPQLDINAFIAKLADPDYNVQAQAMAATMQVALKAPEVADELLDKKVIDTLINVMTKDTSKLEGPTAQQIQIREKMVKGEKVTKEEAAEAEKTTPMELAERNKLYSMYTLASLQKVYADNIQKMNGTTPPLAELPGAAEIVEQATKNPNPMVRASALDALSYNQKPEYKKDLETIFKTAQNDEAEFVRVVAQEALKELSKAEEQPKA